MDVSSGQSRVMALLPNAYMQGECAGVNMAGGEKRFDRAIPVNAVSFFGLRIMTAGTYRGDIYSESAGENDKRLFYGGNKLNGFIFIGDVAKAGAYTNLIRGRTPLDPLEFPFIVQ
jgi:NAD(P)H-nitrite reductase large subunit